MPGASMDGLSQMTLNRRAIEDLLRGSEVARELNRRGEIGLREAKRLCPTSPAGHPDPESDGAWLPSGHLRASLFYELGEDSDGLYVDIGTYAAEAIFVEYGTAPHGIDSHGEWPLRSTDRSGSTTGVYGRHVDHPGTAAQPFLRPGLEAALRG